MNYIISFPRSGQNLTESVLSHLSNKYNFEFNYCDYYNKCNNIPCSCGSNFQKNHDFYLNPLSNQFNLDFIEISENDKYLVLYREDMILQLESYYRYYLKFKNKEYNFEELLNFIKNNIDYYKNFVNKWVKSGKENIIVIEYYDLVNNCDESFSKIVNHFFNKKINDKLSNIEFSVGDGFNSKKKSKISLINKIDSELYEIIKKEIEDILK
jgi:hypothetical protein